MNYIVTCTSAGSSFWRDFRNEEEANQYAAACIRDGDTDVRVSRVLSVFEKETNPVKVTRVWTEPPLISRPKPLPDDIRRLLEDGPRTRDYGAPTMPIVLPPPVRNPLEPFCGEGTEAHARAKEPK